MGDLQPSPSHLHLELLVAALERGAGVPQLAELRGSRRVVLGGPAMRERGNECVAAKVQCSLRKCMFRCENNKSTLPLVDLGERFEVSPWALRSASIEPAAQTSPSPKKFLSLARKREPQTYVPLVY